ncbi:MAG: hypothetical protein ACOYMR_17030, partial [Ilumatobacteraceae bacterium]
TTVPPTTTIAVDPEAADLDDTACVDSTPGAIGFRNETSNRPDELRAIGTSTQGRTIWAEHWGTHSGTQVLVLGQVHGDECAPAFMVRAIREQPPADFGIWLVPTLNPDGLAANTRFTASGVDPNRDGFDLQTSEARALMTFTGEVRPALTAHLHSPYGWVGAHNGGIATRVAAALVRASGFGGPFNAGRVRRGTQAFLWEGQERVIPGHPSVLVEFPGLTPTEAPDAPKPEQRRVATPAEVDAAAAAMRDALYATVAPAP